MNRLVAVGAGVVVVAGAVVAGLPLYAGMQAERELRGLEEMRAGEFIVLHEITEYRKGYRKSLARGHGVVQIGRENIPFDIEHHVRHGLTDIHVDSAIVPTGEAGELVRRFLKDEAAVSLTTTATPTATVMNISVPRAEGAVDADGNLMLNFGGINGTINMDDRLSTATFNVAPLSLSGVHGGLSVGAQKLVLESPDLSDSFAPAESAYTAESVLFTSLSGSGPGEIKLTDLSSIGKRGIRDGMVWIDIDAIIANLQVDDYQADRLRIGLNADNLELEQTRALSEAINAIHAQALDAEETENAVGHAFLNAVPGLLAHSPSLGMRIHLGAEGEETLSTVIHSGFTGNSSGEPVPLGIQNIAQITVDLDVMLQESLLIGLQQALGADAVNADDGISALLALAEQGLATQIPGGFKTEIRFANTELLINGENRSDFLAMLLMGGGEFF
ncbi:MAG: DUF945 family protein [Aquisalimonadaceae bacterium]